MKYLSLFILCCLFVLNGCGGKSTQIKGGTPGSLIAGEVLVPDFEIEVFAADTLVSLGLGATGQDGKFQLMKSKGESPLWLAPGQYVITLKSVGPAHPRILPAYANPAKTPLKVKWNAEDKSLDLKIPAFK